MTISASVALTGSPEDATPAGGRRFGLPPKAAHCPHCEDLRAEVEYLRGELGLNAKAERLKALVDHLHLQPQQARLVLALTDARGRTLSAAWLRDLLGEYDGEDLNRIVRVQIYHARRFLGADTIETVRGYGYRITESGLSKVNAIAAAGRTSPPAP